LAAAIRDRHPSVVLAVHHYAHTLTAVARRLHGLTVPLIAVNHSMAVVTQGWRARARFVVNRHFFPWSTHVVFVSEVQRTYFRDRGVRARSDEVIHNGVDLAAFSGDSFHQRGKVLRRELGLLDGELVVGICAGFRPEKRHVDLLQAVARLAQRGIAYKVLCIGDGVLRPEIERRRDELGLQEQVVLVGLQRDVRPYLAACDVLALTSSTETFPMATLEYMALTKPVVASAVGGIGEQITHGLNGLLFEAGNVDALAARLAQLTAPELRQRLAFHGRQVVEARFSMAGMVSRFERTCQTATDLHSRA
jgi:glycosyltransferase involved in cell wall biosynthesis